MGLAHLSALWWLLLAVPVVLFYLGLRPTRVVVSAGFLWQRALARRTWWQRIRWLVSLGLQLLFLALVVAALTDPYLIRGQALAGWLLLAAMVLTLLEWILFQRRVTV